MLDDCKSNINIKTLTEAIKSLISADNRYMYTSIVAELASCNSVPFLVSCYSDYDTAPDFETEYQSR